MSKFTNSPLVSYTRISPNKNSPRNQDKITKIIVHHMAGVASVESFGELVSKPARQMSANYAIGNDGRIGLYCEEKDRCWCSSSSWADNRGIAIEVSNSKLGEPWPVSTKAWNSLVELCADICKRNGIPKMTYTGDKEGVLLFHRWFAATGCVPIDTTEVLTPDGWVPVRDIRVGDTIATASPKTFTIHFDKVENMTPVHFDTVFDLDGMQITREHRVLFSGEDSNGYKLEEYQKISDRRFKVPTSGNYECKGMEISSSEMIFLLEVQRVGIYNEDTCSLEFRYISDVQAGYLDGLLKNLGYEFTRELEDLGPTKFTVTDKHAWSLVKSYLSGKDFNWKWLEMNPTQFSYFIQRVTSHVGTSWARRYESDSMVNIDVVQALCAFNSYGTKFIPSEHALYTSEAYREVDTKNCRTEDDIQVACVTVRSGCFLMRQNGQTTLTGNCPGEYLFSRAQRLCDEVNAKLEATSTPEPEKPAKPEQPKEKQPALPKVDPIGLSIGCMVQIASDATYYNGAPIPKWVQAQRWYVTNIIGSRVVLGKNESNNSNINSPVDAKYLTVVQNAAQQKPATFVAYVSKVKRGTQIFSISGNKATATSKFYEDGVFTIMEELVIDGVKYGKLKSGAGWIVLSTNVPVVDNSIKVGDTVSVVSPVQYDGTPFVVYEKTYKVLRVNGDRVVISSDGKNVTAAVRAANLKKE